MQQQQYQRQMIQKQTFVNRSNSQVISQSKFKGFAEVSQINNNYKNQQQQYNTQIKPSQTLTNSNRQYSHQNFSQNIKQTKASMNQNANPTLRTQTSSPLSFQTPSLQNYQKQSSKNSLDDEISEQQIALAQMASMQNQQNPNYQNLQAITLQQREEELQPEQEEIQEQVQEEVETQQVETEEQIQGGDQMDIEALFITEEESFSEMAF